MHIRPNLACKNAANQLFIVKSSLVINFKEIQEDSLMYGMIWSGLQSCSEAKLIQCAVCLGETATAKWALTFRMWWSFSHGTFSPRKGKQLCCSLGFPPGLHFQLLVNIAIWLQLFLVMIRSLRLVHNGVRSFLK